MQRSEMIGTGTGDLTLRQCSLLTTHQPLQFVATHTVHLMAC